MTPAASIAASTKIREFAQNSIFCQLSVSDRQLLGVNRSGP